MEIQSMNEKPMDPAKIMTRMMGVVGNPVGFFRDMQKTGGYLEPLVVVLIAAVISFLIRMVYGLFGLGIYGGYGSFATGISAIILIPIYLLLGSFIGGAVYFAIVKLMGSKENYEVAFRCVAYSSAIYPVLTALSVIPYLGSLTQALWPVSVLAVASIHVHGIKKNTAWIVFGVIGIIFAISAISTEYAARHIANDLYNLKYNLNMENK